jgi:succinate dehydrogenase / fumarate reductase cytochrome b subunit
MDSERVPAASAVVQGPVVARLGSCRVTNQPQTASQQGFLEKHHFLLRRLHSLTGIVPIGVFLIAHLTTNSSLIWGKFGLRSEGKGESLVTGGVHYFWKEVQWINNQIPHLLLIELVLWISIAFHSILGVYYARTGKGNTSRYAYQDNWRYNLQRITGYIAIFYIFYHIATLRWGWSFLIPGDAVWSADYAASTLAAALRGSDTSFTFAGILVSLFYFIGITASVYHFANGLWTAAITWGITISATSQKRWGVACAGLGAGLMALAWMSLAGALMTPPAEMRRVEQKLLDKGAATKLPKVEEANADGNAGNPLP